MPVASRRAALAALVAWPVLGAGGCATITAPQARALGVTWPAGRPRQVELDAVPFFPQTPLHCGPAALATVLVQAGIATTPEALTPALFLPARQGTLALEMLAAARGHGRVAMRLPGELAAIVQTLAAGQPVVVLQNLGLSLAPRWHYAVVVGYDIDAGTLVLRSGTVRREVMALATFEHTWARGGRWALVVARPGEVPDAVTEAAALEAALAFERVAPPADAARHYGAVLARWPGSLAAGMGLGNARYAAKDLTGAAEAFDAAARRHDAAAAWNNLALVRWELGDKAAAHDALRQALRRVATDEPQLAEAVNDTRARLGPP